MYGKVTNCWLTVNRACNLGCHWCYAKNADLQDMNLNQAKKVIDFLSSIDVKKITLIGGEPTIYKDICEIIQESKFKGIKIGMVTNGIALKDAVFLSKLIDCGLSSIGLSLKGYDRQSFIDTTGRDCYLDVLDAIRVISSTNIIFSVAFVLTRDNIEYIHKGISDAIQAGAKRIRLSFCYDFDACRTNKKAIENPYLLARLFEKQYPIINEVSNGNFSLFQSLPLCVWNEEFINMLSEKSQLTSICQVLSKSGLIFDTDLSVIPCNAMYDYKIGLFERDFYNKTTFEEYWNGEAVTSFYDKLRSVPDNECLNCSGYSHCGGGCVSNWFNYSFSELREMNPSN